MKNNKFISCVLTASMVISAAAMPCASADNGRSVTPQASYDWTESLNRGLTAVPISGGIYLSWRLQEDEDSRFGSGTENVSFDIYRDGVKIATESDTTNYIDAGGKSTSKYAVVKSGESVSAYKDTQITMSSGGYIDIPLTLPEDETITDSDGNSNTYSFAAADCSAGDVDGDGEYEIIVKFVSHELDVGSAGYSGTVRFNAYKLDGTRLWKNDINLGRNVFSSAHTAQFLVYDFDGDGKAEMTVQTSLGSTDAAGKYVSNASNDSTIKAFTDTENAEADFREAGNGRITTGQEFLTVFNGETGEAIDTISYPTDRVSLACWGKSNDGGNRSQRFLADVAYLDGEKPYAVYWRGYYNHSNGRTGIAGISFDGKRLSVDYIFDTLKGQNGYTSGNEKYAGEGNHNLTVADVDNDGKDEVLSGAMCMEVDDNNKLNPKWCTFKGHGDALHIGDYDPTHEGLEFFTVHEEGGGEEEGVTLDYGMSVIDAATGEIMFHQSNTKDTGRGMMANVGSGGYYQITGIGTYQCNGGTDFTSTNNGMGNNFRIFWDGDLYDELLNGTTITSWNGKTMASIFTASGCTQINSTKANPALQADLFGDWREEVVYPTSSGNALRVYTTTTKTDYKIKSLMYDKVYRMGVAAEQTTYNQPPHIGFYLSDELFNGTLTGISLNTSGVKKKYYVGEEFDKTGLKVIGKYSDADDTEVNDYSVSGYDPMQVGTQTITVKYLDFTKTYTVNVIDESGISVSSTKTTYNVGEDFDKSALSVNLVYADKTKKAVSGYKVSGYDSMKAGEQDVTITYSGEKDTYTDTITVNVKTDFTADTEGVITGYAGSESEVYIPCEIPVSSKYMINEIDGTDAKLYLYDNKPDIYAAAYDSDGVLENFQKLEITETGDVTLSADFNIDKVFIWKNMRPVDNILDKTAAVTSIRDGALSGSALQKVYISDDSLVLDGDDIFPSGVTIVCNENSTAYKYATEHNIAVELIKTGDSVTFDEDFYLSYAGGNMLMQTTSASTLKDEFITYNTSAAANGAPWYAADNYGFKIVSGTDSNYLSVNAGIYDSMNQFNQVYITLNEPKAVTENQTISFDIMFPTGSTSPYVEMQNEAGTVIDTISGLTSNTWYRYELAFSDGAYTRTIYDANGSKISSSALTVTNGSKILSAIVFKQGFTASGTNGGITGIVNIDNLLLN